LHQNEKIYTNAINNCSPPIIQKEIKEQSDESLSDFDVDSEKSDKSGQPNYAFQ